VFGNDATYKDFNMAEAHLAQAGSGILIGLTELCDQVDRVYGAGHDQHRPV
jgi:hypothetical protein